MRVGLDLLRVGFEGGRRIKKLLHTQPPTVSFIIDAVFAFSGRRRGRHACRVLA